MTTAETTANGRTRESLLQMAEASLAQSLLIFMLADLRILSATGRIRTPFESLAIDSDRAKRTSAQELAGYDNAGIEGRGLTPSLIMGLFLLEIDSEEGDFGSPSLFGDDSEHHKGGKIKRKKVNMSADAFQNASGGLDALIKCYKDMVASDVADTIPSISKLDYPLDPPDPKDSMLKLKTSSLKSSFAVMEAKMGNDDDDGGEDEALFKVPKPPDFRPPRALRRQDEKRKLDLQALASIQNTLLQGITTEAQSSDDIYERADMLKLVEQCIKKRDDKRLEFVESFFKQGSVSRVLVENKTELVWLHDWYPTKECTYAIAISRAQKRVHVIFRGAITNADWSHILDWNPKGAINPISDEYPNRLKRIKLHGGFHKYLFRVRKDTGTTKYDEIASKLEHYCNKVGEGYKVFVTGHSLGGALSTVFSFYASTEERFTRNGPIEAITFGCPFVAGYQFAEAFRHQEAAGKLRMARFFNVKDGVPHGPPALLRMSKRGAAYFHVGLSVKLPMIRKGIFRCLLGQPQPIVRYAKPESFAGSFCRQITGYYFWNIPIRFWKLAQSHTLNEHQQRLLLIDTETSPLCKYTLEELYEQNLESK